jgi:serine/threonine-protein kinase
VTLVVSDGPASATVPSVVGSSEDNAIAALEAQGFQVDTQDQEVIDPSQDGKVISQSPSGGSDQDAGSTVTIVVGRNAFADGGTN